MLNLKALYAMASLSTGITLFILGTPRVQTPSVQLTLERKTAAVLAYLAIEGETPKYKLAGWLWPESGETAARNNMRQLLRRFRLSLAENVGPEIIVGDARIALNPDIHVDVRQLSYLDSPLLEHLQETGEVLEGFDYDDAPDFADWLATVRQELHDLSCRTAQQEAERLERLGNFTQALAFALRWQKLDPLSEAAALIVSRLYYQMSDKRNALSTLERFRRHLQDELGLTLSPESETFLKTVQQNSKLQVAPARPKENRLPGSILRPPILAGREREWQQMEEAWEEGKIIFLVGEAGSGKTRLATDFLASKGGFVSLETRPGDANVPYSANNRFVRNLLARYPDYVLPAWVRQTLAYWLPELGQAAPSSDPGLQTRYFEAVADVFKQIGPHHDAAFIDDLQFMDDISVQTGEYILSQLFPLHQPGGLQGFITCYRKGELSPVVEHIHTEMVSRAMARRIFVEPLSDDAISLMLSSLGLADTEHLVPGLARYTGGNPLFILETMKHLIETDSLKQGLPSRLAPQGKVASLIARRLQRLSPLALNLARVASVAVSGFNLELATFVLERPALALAEAHAELEQAQILSGNAFSHDLVFEAVLANIPTAVKELLHARTAKYLESLTNPNPAMLAQHYVAAGEDLRAADYWLQASQQAQRTSLLKEALDFAQRAVASYHKHDDSREYVATANLFDIYCAHGSFEDLSTTSARLVQLARNNEEKLDAMAKWAEMLGLRRHYQEGLEKVDEALAFVDDTTILSHASLRQTELYCCLKLGQFARAKTALEGFRSLVAQLDLLEATASLIEDEGLFYATLDEHEKALLQFDQTLALIEEHEHYQFAKVRLHYRKAASELALGLLDAALTDTEAAIRASETYDVSSRGYVVIWTYQASIYLALGNLPGAWDAMQKAQHYDQEENPRMTQVVLARVLQALGQDEPATEALSTFLDQKDPDLIMKIDALLLLGELNRDEKLLEDAEGLVRQIPKPEAQIRLALAKIRFAPPEESLALTLETLKLATSLKLKPLEAALLLRRAQALLNLARFEEARDVISVTLTFKASCVSPAEIYFTAFQIYESLKDSRSKQYLIEAQNWIDQTARALPKDLRKTFLNQALHKKIL